MFLSPLSLFQLFAYIHFTNAHGTTTSFPKIESLEKYVVLNMFISHVQIKCLAIVVVLWTGEPDSFVINHCAGLRDCPESRASDDSCFLTDAYSKDEPGLFSWYYGGFNCKKLLQQKQWLHNSRTVFDDWYNVRLTAFQQNFPVYDLRDNDTEIQTCTCI